MGISEAARALATKKSLPITEISARVAEKLGLPLARVRVAVGGAVYGNPSWKKTGRGVFQFVG